MTTDRMSAPPISSSRNLTLVAAVAQLRSDRARDLSDLLHNGIRTRTRLPSKVLSVG